jgi:uncharacterized protein
MYNSTVQTANEQYDIGLRNFMISVYNHMCAALVVSGLVAYYISTNSQLVEMIWKTPLAWVVVFLPLVMSIGIAFFIERVSPMAARILLYLFAFAMGISLSSLFVVFKLGSIVQVFFITSATFASVSLYGYTTKRDLSGLGTFLFMGLIGVVIAGVVNIFLQSSVLSFVVSMISVLVFTGLTAYDTQQLKDQYSYDRGEGNTAIIGAMNLYMNFINIFINLLQLLGEKNES